MHHKEINVFSLKKLLGNEMANENWKTFNISQILHFISGWIHSMQISLVFYYIFPLHCKLETKTEVHKTHIYIYVFLT
jgi:hypothetical protein